MRRWLCIATFGLALLALPVWAQRHGGGSSGGAHFSSSSSSSSRGFSAPHSSMGHSSIGRSSIGRSSSGRSSSGRSSIGRSSSGRSTAGFRGGSFSRGYGVRIRIGNQYSRGFYGRRGYSPYAGYYPYYGWYTDPLYDANDQDSYAADSTADYSPALAPYRDDSGTQRGVDLDQLNGKVDRLQQDVAARNRPKLDPEPATALVFRDQHVEEVHNYAISGGMLWVLNDQAAKKIPLAQLDLDATVKMNGDRGVDFQVPGPALQIMIMN